MAQERFLNPPMPDVMKQWTYYLKQLHIQPGDSVLDVGCNRGDTEHLLVNLYPDIAKVVGVDVSEKRLADALETWKDRGENKKIEFTNGDATCLPFADESFDKIICAEVLEWIKQPEKAITEIKRVLKPGGLAMIQHTDWDQTAFPTKNIDKTRKIIQRFGDSGPDGIIGRKLLGLCNKIGFQNVTPVVYTLTNDTFEENDYSYKLANMIKEWLLIKKLMSEQVLDSWVLELKEMAANDEYFFSINRYITICKK